MVTLLDNKTYGRVGEALAQKIAPGAHLSILTNAFSVYAYAQLNQYLSSASTVRFLHPALPSELNPSHIHPFSAAGLVGDAADRRLRNTLTLARVARDCATWVQQKASVKAVLSAVPQNLYHVANPDGGALVIQGSSPFTSSGLGFAPSAAYEMNTSFTEEQQTAALLVWFDNLWTTAGLSRDTKAELLSQLEEIYASKSPELIYFLTLYHTFHEFLGELDEEKIIKSQTGIRETVVWKKLYRFQRDGVLGAIDKIEKYNGCIIADSVGLGKTFEALAVIKYYELRNDRVLVLCPKKLRENWTLYTVNDKRNILAADRFNYDVLNHTDLTRTAGYSDGINLETVNWGNYDLVVIDESHNFRNSPPRKDGVSRYSRLMHDIIKSGVKTKVLMLSATPVNSRMNDLKNQVAFVTEGVDGALSGRGIASIEETLRKAQARFNHWLKLDASQRTASSLLETLNLDYFKLLDLLTIARSRKHITKYYDAAEVGKFPERDKPINIKADIDSQGQFPPLREINREIRRLNLSAYAPLKYVLPEKRSEYSDKYDMAAAGGSTFKQTDRETNLIHLMRVNLLKRMESSLNSFTLTVERLLGEVRGLIKRIDSHGDLDLMELSIEEIEVESEEFAPYLIGNKVKVLLQDVDHIRWKQELQEDEEILERLLQHSQTITAARDLKLQHLKDLIAAKCRNPINPENKKVLIFTAFADTAEYLYEHIAQWAKAEAGLYTAQVTGRSDSNKTTMPKVRRDIASILTSFSPVSKERSKVDSSLTDEIDILIATDCISEGQNLQDCDYVVNYDIHWNPVRIIQRFGRVDRLGTRNERIQLVNFWPNMELDEYINLEARVSGRMVLLDISATGEENVIEFSEADKMNDLEYRRRQLEQLQNEVVDLEDLSNGISITDLTLNDFRMDLAEYMKGHADRLAAMPPGAFAVSTLHGQLEGEEIESGAIFCLRNESSKNAPDRSQSPGSHYLVYVSDSGEVRFHLSHAKKVLDLFSKLARGRSKPDPAAAARFDALTRNGSDMSHYQALLAKAVAAITGKAEERGVESLFHRGGTILSRDAFQGIDDFEVIAYLIILGEGGEA